MRPLTASSPHSSVERSSVIGQYISSTATRPYGNTGPGYGLSREAREVRMRACSYPHWCFVRSHAR